MITAQISSVWVFSPHQKDDGSLCAIRCITVPQINMWRRRSRTPAEIDNSARDRVSENKSFNSFGSFVLGSIISHLVPDNTLYLNHMWMCYQCHLDCNVFYTVYVPFVWLKVYFWLSINMDISIVLMVRLVRKLLFVAKWCDNMN